jgi:hypothetical protein
LFQNPSNLFRRGVVVDTGEGLVVVEACRVALLLLVLLPTLEFCVQAFHLAAKAIGVASQSVEGIAELGFCRCGVPELFLELLPRGRKLEGLYACCVNARSICCGVGLLR